MKKKHSWHIAATVLFTIFLDQLSKWYLLYQVGMIARPPIVVTEFFSFVMVWNKGVSFGMLNNAGEWGPFILIALSLVISGILLRLALKTPLLWERIAYAMVIGGALGNVIDRVRFRAVADFFYFHLGDLGYPAFNVADSAIFVGVVILLIMLLKSPKQA